MKELTCFFIVSSVFDFTEHISTKSIYLCQILSSVSLLAPQNVSRLVLLVCFSHSLLHPAHICGTESKHLKNADYV